MKSSGLSGFGLTCTFLEIGTQNYRNVWHISFKSMHPWDFDKLEGHDFFLIDLAYRVTAKLTVTEGDEKQWPPGSPQNAFMVT